MARPFVPEDFVVPIEFSGTGFRLEPLGPQHNRRDHEAWTSSMDWIQSTPGYPDGNWPREMSEEANLEDLEMHARHFEDREGFTYSILDGESDQVIGCAYIYPYTDSNEDLAPEVDHDADVRSWVRESHSELDAVVYRELSRWLADVWPFANPDYASRP